MSYKVLLWCLIALAQVLPQASQAQTGKTLSADFTLTDYTIDLPAQLAQSVGFPKWRMVEMRGEEAVPYNYCAWYLDHRRWALPLFGMSADTPTEQMEPAVATCADGISSVTKAAVDSSLPLGMREKMFWKTRPVGYRYMAPDAGLSELEYLGVMGYEPPEALGFVTDPQQLQIYLQKLAGRLEGVEAQVAEHQGRFQALDAEGGPVTRDYLDQRLNQLPQQQPVYQPPPVVVNNHVTVRSDPAPLLPPVQAGATAGWPWYWNLIAWLALLLALVLAAVALLLHLRINRQLTDGETGLKQAHERAGQALTNASTAQSTVNEAKELATDVADQVAQVRSGLEAVIELDAKSRFDALDFTNQKLRDLGDVSYPMRMPGKGAARKKVEVRNHPDHLELYGVEKGHDRVEETSVAAVYQRLAEALRSTNDWVTGLTEQRKK